MVKNPLASAGDAGDMGLTPGLRRSPGEGNSNAVQYSGLKNPMDISSLMDYCPQDHKELDTTEHSTYSYT